ncbi:uncharacterized protein LOC131879617 [Tigriopus californicus]|uniref:uncharacterized protein LOC131879617 n=1 Tax=Tigriopus californicus TaxID=6832 RepID=UPI0027DA29D7|nr:uncharacterized protein LOC131879617 [Tigriopus californicus]
MAEKLIQELAAVRVIVPCNVPTEWTSPMHFVGKPGGKKVFLVTDYRQLNKAVKRHIHPFYSANDLMRKVPLDEDSSLLTALSGKWFYTLAPMGLSSSSDEFNIRTDRAVACLGNWLLKIVDDMAFQDPTLDLALSRLELVLERCRKAGIKLSLDKMQIGQEISYTGFVLS